MHHTRGAYILISSQHSTVRNKEGRNSLNNEQGTRTRTDKRGGVQRKDKQHNNAPWAATTSGSPSWPGHSFPSSPSHPKCLSFGHGFLVPGRPRPLPPRTTRSSQ